MKKNNKSILLFILIFFSSVIMTLLMLKYNYDQNHWLLSALPAFFVIILIFCYDTFSYLFKSISVLFLVGCYFMRMVVLPFIYVIFGYSSLVMNTSFSSYITQACLLTVYEFLMVMIFCNIIIKRNLKNVENNELKSDGESVTFEKNKKANRILLILIAFVLIAYILHPELKHYFHFIFETSYEKQNADSVNFAMMFNSVPKMLYWLTVVAFGILQVLIPIQIINYIKKTKLTQNIKFLLSIFVISVVLLIATPDVAKSVIIALALSIMLLKLYPNKKRIIFTTIFLGFVPAVIFGIFIKSGVREFGNVISSVLQAYFSGIPNIATSFLLPRRPQITMIFVDIVKAIPFVLAFFKDIQSTPNLFNYVLYNNVAGYHTQIIPMVGQSLYYFGFILAPIFSVISASVSLFCEKKYKQITYMGEKYIYLIIAIFFAITPVVYNFSIITTTSIQLLIPCLLIIKLKRNNREIK